MATANDIIIKLAADSSALVAGLNSAGGKVDAFTRKTDAMERSLSGVAAIAKGAFAAAIGVVSVRAITSFVSGAMDSAAALKDLAEQTGSSAESLSRLSFAAALSGTPMDNIGSSMAKLSKAMASADKDGSSAQRALSALGVSAKDAAGHLRDPSDVMNDIAIKLSQFQDGAGKTAVAMDLFGKSGASLIPFLNDLAENQDASIKLTNEQIDAMERADKAMARMKAQADFAAQSLVASFVPAMTVLGEELARVFLGTDNAIEGITALRNDGTLERWAKNTAYSLAVVIDALRGVAGTARAVVGSFEAVWADIELAGVFLAGGEGLNPWSDKNRAILKAALDKRNAIVQESNKRYVDLWKMPLAADAIEKRFADADKRTANLPIRVLGRKPLDYKPYNEGKGAAGDKDADFWQQVERDQALLFKGILPDNIARAEEYQATLLAIGESVRATNKDFATQALQFDAAAQEEDRAAKAAKELADAGKALYEQTRTPLEKMNLEFDRLNGLLQAGAIDWDTYARATMAAQDKFSESTAKIEEESSAIQKIMEDAGRTFTDFFANMMTGTKQASLSFSDMARSITNDLMKIQIQKRITDPLVKAGTSFLDSFFSSIKFEDGGIPGGNSISAYRNQVVNRPTLFAFASGAGLMGEAGPEAILPLTRTASGDLGVKTEGGGGSTNVHITYNIQSWDSRDTLQAIHQSAPQIVGIVQNAFNKRGRSGPLG